MPKSDAMAFEGQDRDEPSRSDDAIALKDYPKLAAWYQARAKSTGTSPPAEELARTVCAAMIAGDPRRSILLWTSGVDAFLDGEFDHQKVFLEADSLLEEHDVGLLDWLGRMAHIAISADVGVAFFDATRRLADAVPLTALRFLSAWTALNLGDYRACADECETVGEPFAAVHTLHGQALLELGEPGEAIEILRVSVSLAPEEIIAWFQLTKAYMVTGDVSRAWDCAGTCERLVPGNPEVALMKSLIALQEPQDDQRIAGAKRSLGAQLGSFSGNSDVVSNLMELALLSNDMGLAAEIVRLAQFDRLAKSQLFLGKLATILRGFKTRGWHEVAKNFLDGLTAAAG